MASYFATEYTVHFDDTMAYGSHHFLTSFKFQCAARETFMFGELIFDVDGVKEALDQIHLLTSDAYSRNLKSTTLGDRVAVLLSLEEWGQASARFCYRVIDENGDPICAGFQTLICADAKTSTPIPLPKALQQAMNQVRQIEETVSENSFRECVLAGGGKLESLFGQTVRDAAVAYLADRYPKPAVIRAQPDGIVADPNLRQRGSDTLEAFEELETWVFAGQGAFDAHLLSERIFTHSKTSPDASLVLGQCAAVASEILGGDAAGLLSGSVDRCLSAIKSNPNLIQVGIHLQNVLGARQWQSRGHEPALLMGHSFGEIAALELGGCFDAVTGVRIVCHRAKAITSHAPKESGLLAIQLGRHQAETETRLLGLDQVMIAGRNHETQTILSGPLDQLERLKRFLQSINVPAVNVPSPTSFHHPRLRQAASQWRDAMNELPIRGPVRQVYSPIGRRLVSANDDVSAVLAAQLLRPFDLLGAVADAVSWGTTKFVDCGSTGSLGKLISKTSGTDAEVRIAIPGASKGTTASRTAFASNESVAPVQKIEPIVTEKSAGSRSSSNETARDHSPANTYTVPTIAIVGSGCILPGRVGSPEQLFDAIAEQRPGITDLRQVDPHWSEDFYSETLVPDRSTSHLSGRVNDQDIQVPKEFDPAIFHRFTRAQKLLCIALVPCVASIKHADRVMCLIGATADGFEDQDEALALQYAGIDPSDPEVDARLGTGKSIRNTPHAAVQEVFDAVVRPGLNITLVDAACASSLYTVALGMQALETDKTDVVIAGGCFCPGPGNSCLFSQFHGTTSTGCRPFDASADGVVFSEGAALVTLRRAADANRFGLPIQASVRGVGLSSDGRSPSANVPQSSGQLLSLQRCYESYNIDPRTIPAIEGHGTSTSVGDSTELETLRQFFEHRTLSPIPVHSLKGTLGHAGWAAGTASIIAACEYLRRGIFPAQAGHKTPSDALTKARDTLTVPTRPIAMAPGAQRIAIDGFGFGGANAHLVLENGANSDQVQKSRPEAPGSDSDDANDLVIVACHHLDPTERVGNRLRFDRTQVGLPDGCVVLPELADDMDISQTLAVTLTKQIVEQLPNYDQQLRRQTGLVLAMQGKTDRGVEATARIMADRFRRKLDGLDDVISSVENARERARPSGPYTLQCMMPNVATGRAALLHNLNGPNFVVDAGDDSVSAAFSSAALLLGGGHEAGTQLAIVAAIEARLSEQPSADGQSRQDEYAAAFGVTTRQLATKNGWNILSPVGPFLRTDPGDSDAPSTHQQLRALLRLLGRTLPEHVPSTVPENPAGIESDTASFPISHGAVSLELPPDQRCTIHTPVWIERRRSTANRIASPSDQQSIVFVTPADPKLIAELSKTLATQTESYTIASVGNTAKDVVSNISDPRVVAVDVLDEASVSHTLELIDRMQPHSIVAVDRVTQWDLSESLASVANDNSLCEFMFLAAQRFSQLLSDRKLDLWSVFVDGYLADASNGSVHPKSGAIAGLFKSVRRELRESRLGCVCTRGLDLLDAIRVVLAERDEPSCEPEIVFDGNVRLVRRLRPTPTHSKSTTAVELNADSVVIASGGAKGVTAVMLETLLRDYQCTVVALGRSPLEAGPTGVDEATAEQDFYSRFLEQTPGATALDMKQSFHKARARWEAHETIQRLKSAGGRVHYVVADITDAERVSQVIDGVVSRHGKVDLLVHGAGIQLSKKLEDRTLSEFQTTFRVKVEGLANLTSSIRRRTGAMVATHVLTSAYSIFGNDGQHDYGAANETMDRVCDLTRWQHDPHWTSLAWLAWDGVGMTRGSEYRVLAAQRGLSGVDAPTGQRLFREVMSGHSGASINVPLSESEHIKYELATIPSGDLMPIEPGRLLEVPVTLSEIECLRFHKVRDTPTLPGAWILERLVNAAMQLAPDHDQIANVIVRDMCFMRFVRFVNDQEPNVRVIVEQRDKSVFAWMISDVLHPSGHVLAKDVVCAKASLSFDQIGQHSDSSVDHPSLANGFDADRTLHDPYCEGANREVDLSGPFSCLGEIKVSRGGRCARFVPENVCEWPGIIPALLLDAAWRVAAVYAIPGSDALFVPVQIDRMVIPVGDDMNSLVTETTSEMNWEIRSTPPKPDGRYVRWSRTEVLDSNGALRLVVENGFARQIS